MRKTRSLTPVTTAALTFAAAAIFSLTAGASATFAKGPNDPATECLIALRGAPLVGSADTAFDSTLSCTDGAGCDADGKTDGSCTIKVKACVNLSGVAGCTPQALKGSPKVTPKKYGITATPNGTTQACGDFKDVVLKLKGKPTKRKPSKKVRLVASAKGTEKKAKDVDKTKLQCVPCGQESCTTTTTTTTTITPTTVTPTTLPVCGDGIIAAGEVCDPQASPSGCFVTQLCNPTTCAQCEPKCGNGVVDAGEACDPAATPTGCANPLEFCDTATCASCGAPTQLSFTLGVPTIDCGFPGQGSAALPPISGELRDDQNMKTTAGELGSGCLYIGGGIASSVPPGPTPDGSETLLAIADGTVNNLTLGPADTGSSRTCTIGPASSMHCTNGIPGTDSQGACTTDDDCQGACTAGHCRDGAKGSDGNGACAVDSECGPSFATGPAKLVCQPDPSCYFGGPLPIANGGLSTCVLNVVKDGVTGTADRAAGSAIVTLPLKSWVFLTGLEDEFNPDAGGHPCPVCEGTPKTCSAGPRKGLPCETDSGLGVTHDCPPPDHLFLAPLDVTLGPLASSPVTVDAADLGTCGAVGCQNGLPTCCSGNTAAFCSTDVDCQGIFCQEPGNIQKNGGAFGQVNARHIVQNGSPAAGGLDNTPKDATLASVFCIPATNSALIDGSANLPGPGTTALAGSVRLR